MDNLIAVSRCHITAHKILQFFLARELTMVGDNPEVDENITLEIHSLDEVHRLIKENIIEDAKTIIGILNVKK